MSGMDHVISASLRERSAAPVDITALISDVMAHGRARRRRRRLARGAAAVVVAVASVGLAVVLAPRPGDRPVRFDGFAPVFHGRTQLPRAPGVPGARTRPDLVGTDPAVLHFDAIALTGPAPWHTWTSGPGYEQLEAAVGPNGVAYVTIGRDPALLDAVADEPNLPWVVRERVADGLWLRAAATREELSREVAQAVTLNESQQCVLPYQLSVRPANTAVTTCYVGFRNGHYAEGGLVLGAAQGRSMEVQAQYAPGFPNRKTANHRCGGRSAFLFPGGQEVEVLLGYPGLYLSARIGGPYRGFDLTAADAVLGAVTVASDVELMRTWPRSPVPT